MKKSVKKLTSKEFDKKFDNGKDVGDFLDASKARMHKNIQRVNIDFPIFFLYQIDKEAKKVGVPRSALIKLWLAERLKHGV